MNLDGSLQDYYNRGPHLAGVQGDCHPLGISREIEDKCQRQHANVLGTSP